MSRSRLAAAIVAAVAALSLAVPSQAHHSFALYDMQKVVEVDGTVVKFEWSNPHSWLFISVPAASGSQVYGFQMSSVGQLVRLGWAKNSIKAGDRIKVSFHPMRDGTHNGLLTTVQGADGKPIGHAAG